jgi:co-chaperonin GroES (HSP10)
MKVEPASNYILLQKYIGVSKSNLILPDDKKNKHWGTVLDIGTDCNPVIIDCLVQVKPFSQIPVENSDDLFLVKEEDIIAFINLDKN